MGKLRALKRCVTNSELKGFWDVKIKKQERFGENWLKERVVGLGQEEHLKLVGIYILLQDLTTGEL